ncbi:MAG: hypothetical protein F6J97_06540 [Leptolyngbya sp. SIO4C1]|nr:hypothetical protein [Leptolyngbya sp. SIO4C1]
MPVWLIWLIVILATGLVILLARWQAYTQTLPSGLIFEPAHPTDYPTLDQFAFDQGSEAMTLLGFVPIRDALLTAEQGKLNQQFSRLFWHPVHHCYAQLCTAFDRSPQLFTIVSLFENNWRLQTTTQQPNPLSSLTVLDKSAWYHYPKASTRELLEHHLRHYEQLLTTHGLTPITIGDAETFYAKTKEETFRRKQVMKRQMTVLSFVKGAAAFIRPRKEWDGVLRGKRARAKSADEEARVAAAQPAAEAETTDAPLERSESFDGPSDRPGEPPRGADF